MKKKNFPKKLLNYYREQLKKYIDEEEVRMALEQPIQFNLMNVKYYSAYYAGANAALRMCVDWFSEQIKTKEKVYVRACLELAAKSPRHTEMFLQQQPIRFRNHVKKGTKLVSVEAYFYKEVTMAVEVE